AHAETFTFDKISLDHGVELIGACETCLETRLIQVNLLRIGGKLFGIGVWRIGVQQTAVLPELALFGGAASGLVRRMGGRMQLVQRKIAVNQSNVAVVLREHALDGLVHLLAERALKILELDNRHRSVVRTA